MTTLTTTDDPIAAELAELRQRVRPHLERLQAIRCRYAELLRETGYGAESWERALTHTGGHAAPDALGQALNTLTRERDRNVRPAVHDEVKASERRVNRAMTTARAAIEAERDELDAARLDAEQIARVAILAAGKGAEHLIGQAEAKVAAGAPDAAAYVQAIAMVGGASSGVRRRLADLRDDLRRMLGSTDPDYVRLAERGRSIGAAWTAARQQLSEVEAIARVLAYDPSSPHPEADETSRRLAEWMEG